MAATPISELFSSEVKERVKEQIAAERLQQAKRGADHPNWKGGGAGYRSIHIWLSKHHPKTGTCEECGGEKPTDYALIHGRTYTRDRDDYRELCRRCHRVYDGASE